MEHRTSIVRMNDALPTVAYISKRDPVYHTDVGVDENRDLVEIETSHDGDLPSARIADLIDGPNFKSIS